MADQRKAGKKQVCVWLSVKERATLRKLAKEQKSTMAEILKDRINERINKTK